MEKFLLIVREDLSRIGKLTTEERLSTSPDMMPWVESLIASGKYIGGEPLMLTGRYVTQHSVVSDGPFLESKEGVSGYDIIEAENIEEAVKIAQSCPMVKIGHAIREVRPLMNIEEFLPKKG
jgi:hypothetical protein